MTINSFMDIISFIKVSTPLFISKFDLFLNKSGDIEVLCYRYDTNNVPHLIHESGQKGVAGLNTIITGLYLNPGRYGLRLRSKGGVLVKNTTMTTNKHRFISFVGGSEVGGYVPPYSDGQNPNNWWGAYNLLIDFSPKSLYLGVEDAIIGDEYLVKGAFYFWLRSNKMTMCVFDGVGQKFFEQA